MGKYIIDIEHEDMIVNGHLVIPLEVCVQGNEEKIKFNCELANNLTPYTEPDMEQVRKEAWEAARTLWNTPKRKEIFGYTSFNTALMTLTAQEVIEKIRAYEQAQEKIQVGDEVIRHYKNEFMEGDDAPSIFLSEEDGHFRCLAFNGRSIMIAEYPKNQYRKTGRHFPEITEVLAKMKET